MPARSSAARSASYPDWYARALSADWRRPYGCGRYDYRSTDGRLGVAAAHVRSLFVDGDQVMFVTKKSEQGQPPKIHHHTPAGWGPDHLRKLDWYNERGHDVYLVVNTVKKLSPSPDGKRSWRTRQHVDNVLRVQLDIDDYPEQALPALKADVVSGVIPCPDLVLRSSHRKFQCLWNLPRDDPQWTPAAAEYYSRLIGRRYGGDPSVYPVSQVMRVPGYYNRKVGYADDPPVVRPCALPARDWYRPAGSQVKSVTDFEPLQSVVRLEDLRVAREKAGAFRGTDTSDDALRTLQKHYEGDIRYSLQLQTPRASADGMDVGMVLAAGNEAVARIVDRLDAEDVRSGRSRTPARSVSPPAASSPAAAAARASSRPESGAPRDGAQRVPPPVATTFTEQRRAMRDGIVAGSGVVPSSSVLVIGRDGMPTRRVVKPTAAEIGYALGTNPTLKPYRPDVASSSSGSPGPRARPAGGPASLPSQLDSYDWGLTLQRLEAGYSPEAATLILVQRRTVGEHPKADPHKYAEMTVKRAVDFCRERAVEAGVTWEPGDLGVDGAPPPQPRSAEPESAAAPSSALPSDRDGRSSSSRSGSSASPAVEPRSAQPLDGFSADDLRDLLGRPARDPAPGPAPAAGAAAANDSRSRRDRSDSVPGS